MGGPAPSTMLMRGQSTWRGLCRTLVGVQRLDLMLRLLPVVAVIGSRVRSDPTVVIVIRTSRDDLVAQIRDEDRPERTVLDPVDRMLPVATPCSILALRTEGALAMDALLATTARNLDTSEPSVHCDSPGRDRDVRIGRMSRLTRFHFGRCRWPRRPLLLAS